MTSTSPTPSDSSSLLFQDAVASFQPTAIKDQLPLTPTSPADLMAATDLMSKEDSNDHNRADDFDLTSMKHVSPAPTHEAEKSLSQDLVDIRRAVQMFLNSQFNEASASMRPKFRVSLYHTHGYAVMRTIKAMMSFQPADLKVAQSLLQTTVDVAMFYRRKDASLMGSVATFVRGVDVADMTVLQRHAELVFADSYLLRAILTMLTDDNGVVSFIREGNAYHHCIAVKIPRSQHSQCIQHLQGMREVAKEGRHGHCRSRLCLGCQAGCRDIQCDSFALAFENT